MNNYIYLLEKIDELKKMIESTDNEEFIQSLKKKLDFFQRCLDQLQVDTK